MVKFNNFKKYINKGRKRWLGIVFIDLIIIILLFFAPAAVAPVFTFLILLELYFIFKLMEIDSLYRKLMKATFREIKIKEQSLGGTQNYFLAEGEELEFKAERVYGTCKIGDTVTVITYPDGKLHVICDDLTTKKVY